jgi:hypothetical protein
MPGKSQKLDEVPAIDQLVADAGEWLSKEATQVHQELTELVANAENMSLVKLVDVYHRAVSLYTDLQRMRNYLLVLSADSDDDLPGDGA